MKDLAAVAPLLLVAGVFVGVCIVALRATDWRRLDDRRPVAAPGSEPGSETSADGAPTGDDAADRAAGSDAAEAEVATVAEDATSADASTRGIDPAVAADGEPGSRTGDESVEPDSAAPRGHGRHRAEPGT